LPPAAPNSSVTGKPTLCPGFIALGAVTPLGGVCLLVGWALVAAEAFARRG
jgi:uncharacterized membrane protein YgdD (TMEM256/DUF423 family)